MRCVPDDDVPHLLVKLLLSEGDCPQQDFLDTRLFNLPQVLYYSTFSSNCPLKADYIFIIVIVFASRKFFKSKIESRNCGNPRLKTFHIGSVCGRQLHGVPQSTDVMKIDRMSFPCHNCFST